VIEHCKHGYLKSSLCAECGKESDAQRTTEERARKAREFMAGILREAAQLVEEGVINEWELNQEWGHEPRPDPTYATLRMMPTGRDTVEIKLHVGRLHRDRAQAWLAPEMIYSDSGPMLPRTNREKGA
jgi:hypothetical protein